jgi:hypothetical protein
MGKFQELPSYQTAITHLTPSQKISQYCHHLNTLVPCHPAFGLNVGDLALFLNQGDLALTLA